MSTHEDESAAALLAGLPDFERGSGPDWTFETAEDIHRNGVAPVQFDIEGLQTSEDVVHLFAPPASYKSFLAMHAAQCLVTGDPFLGHFQVRRRPHAAYVNFDAGAQAFRRRVLSAVPATKNLHITSPDQYDVEQMRKLFERFAGGYIVIDCFADVYQGARKGEDQGEVMRHFLRDIRALYQKNECNGIIVDHPRRSKEGETADYYGSIQKEATMRTMWAASRIVTNEPGAAKVKITCRKMSEAEPFAPIVARIAFTPGRFTFGLDAILSESGGIAVNGPSDAELVENLLRDVTGGMKRPAIEMQLGWSKNRTLEALANAGRIRPIGKGPSTRYCHLSVIPDGMDLESSPRQDDKSDDLPQAPKTVPNNRPIVPDPRSGDDYDDYSERSAIPESSLSGDDSRDDSLSSTAQPLQKVRV